MTEVTQQYYYRRSIKMLKKENLLLFWLKQIGIIFIPFVIVYLSIKEVYDKKTAIIMSLVALIVFILFWHNIFSNKDLDETNQTLKKEVNENEVKIMMLNEKLKEQKKATAASKTIKPTKTPIKKISLAQKAYKKLNNVNMENEPYIVALSVIEDVDETFILDGKEIFHDNIFEKWYRWEQIFKFKDGSKIALFKKKDENTSEFIFMPYETKLVKE